MSLCHIYHKTSSSVQVKELLQYFKKSDSIDISAVDLLPHYSIYLIEIENVNKEITVNLKKLFKDKPHSLVYFILPPKYSLPLFQLAFLLNAKAILTLKHELDKVAQKLKSEYLIYSQEYRSLELGSMLINHCRYMIFENKELSYASESLLKDFDCEDLDAVYENVCSKIDIDNLLVNKECIKRDITEKLDDENKYFIKSITNDNSSFIALDRKGEYENDDECPKFSNIATRLRFIETLKDNLIESAISGTQYSTITVKINNVNEILSKISGIDLESFVKDLLLEMEIIMDDKILLSQYDSNFYIAMFKDFDYETICKKAKNFHLQIARFLNKQKFKVELSLYAFDMQSVDLNKIINIFNNIYLNKLERYDVNNLNLKYIDNYRDNMSDDEIINYLFESAYVNHIEIELVNLYKGMSIKSPSEILKKNDDNIYVIFKPIQGAVMSLTKSVVLKSSIFSKDIKATVKYINLREKIAILENFRVLDYDVNARQHGRVGFAKKQWQGSL
jgi:hypothetical protein